MAICLRRALASRGLLSLYGARHFSGLSSLTSLISNSFSDETSRPNPGFNGGLGGFNFSDRRGFAKGRKQSKWPLFICHALYCFISLSIDDIYFLMFLQKNKMKGIQFKPLLPSGQLSSRLPRHKWRQQLLL